MLLPLVLLQYDALCKTEEEFITACGTRREQIDEGEQEVAIVNVVYLPAVRGDIFAATDKMKSQISYDPPLVRCGMTKELSPPSPLP